MNGEKTGEVFPKGGCTIWFADDNEFALGALKGMFSTQIRGVKIGTFCSADALIEQLRQKNEPSGLPTADAKREPDVIFLDQSMPGTGGIDAIRMILQHVPSAKIIMLTHFGYARYVEHAFQQGAYGYIMKDSDPQQLMYAVQAVMQGKKYLDPGLADSVPKP